MATASSPQKTLSGEKKGPIIISIDGPVGVGKSTLVKMFVKYVTTFSYLQVGLVEEAIEDWRNWYGHSLLDDSIHGKNNYLFQTLVLATMYRDMVKHLDKDIIIVERSTLSAIQVFSKFQTENKTLTEMDFGVLKLLGSSFQTFLGVDHVIVLWSKDPGFLDDLNERVLKRDGDKACNEWNESIVKAYEKFLIYLEKDQNTTTFHTIDPLRKSKDVFMDVLSHINDRFDLEL